MSYPKIVLTGGPCAGKTTLLPGLVERVRKYVPVIVVPEVATLLFQGGAKAPTDERDMADFQEHVTHVQIALEDAAVANLQAQGGKGLVVCDRGVMDNLAYCDPREWVLMAERCGWTAPGLLVRYHTVVHLTTAAVGAREHYVNTDIRRESPDAAAAADAQTMRAWMAHQHWRLIDNKAGGLVRKKRELHALVRDTLFDEKLIDFQQAIDWDVDSV